MTFLRKRTPTIVVALVIVALFLYFFFRAPFSNPTERSTEAASEAAAPGASESGEGNPADQPRQNLGGIFKTLNHNAIEFYGRVVDQFGEPVEGASVKASVMVNSGVKSGWRTATAATAPDGRFQFTGLEGQDISFVVSKGGYQFAQREGIYSYTYFEADHKRHIPDPKAPVEFTLWKLQGPEPMIHYWRGSFRFTCDGKPAGLNLHTGRVDNENPDLIVTVERRPQVVRPGAKDFYWKASIEVVEGGLHLAGERDYYNLAPEDGYVPEYIYVQTAQDERHPDQRNERWAWWRSHEVKLFVKTRGGQAFGLIDLRILAELDDKEGDNKAAIIATVYLNPNGSRNLEFDKSISQVLKQ